MQPHRIFAYGTLMFPEVMEVVVGRRFTGRAATLTGHARYAIRGESYPGLAPEAGQETRGMLYQGLDASHVHRLDRFEGDWYERRQVQVQPAGADAVNAFVYLMRAEHRYRMTGEAWDVDRFAARDLAGFLGAYGGFHRL